MADKTVKIVETTLVFREADVIEALVLWAQLKQLMSDPAPVATKDFRVSGPTNDYPVLEGMTLSWTVKE